MLLSHRVTFAELAGETFTANIVRAAGLIEQDSGTMRAELIMPNPEGRIPAGLNGQVAIEVDSAGGAVIAALRGPRSDSRARRAR